MKAKKTIALVAHDNQKKDLVDWVKKNASVLAFHKMVCTGTTGNLIQKMYAQNYPKINPEIKLLKSGPLGGDQQLGSMISDKEIDILIFLTDPMTPQPHDVDVKALIRVAVIYNVAIACNLSTADFILHSSFFNKEYEQQFFDYSKYTNRTI